MEPIDPTVVTPRKGRLARTLAKVLHVRSLAGVTPVDGVHKAKIDDKIKFFHTKEKPQPLGESKAVDNVKRDYTLEKPPLLSDIDAKRKQSLATEAFLAKLFASISTVKAAYAELQLAQSPYDPDGIQAADKVVVAELKKLSELKQSYAKREFESSPEMTLLLAELQELRSLLITYEVMGKKLDSQLKFKNSEITFLKEKLEEANRENRLLEMRINSSSGSEKRMGSSGPLPEPEKPSLSSLGPGNFVSVLHQTVKAIRHLVRFISQEMELADWDLDLAVRAIQPGASFSNPNHRCFAIESFVCYGFFDDFNYPYFSLGNDTLPQPPEPWQKYFFERYNSLRLKKTREYIVKYPTSTFARFCFSKYLKLVHPKMELSLFGNLKQRTLVSSGDYPDTAFFATFSEAAKRVFLLHLLAMSYQPEVSIFQVAKKCRFSEVYMESVNEEPLSESDPRVAFTVVPGFKVGKTVIQSQVYLS